MGEGYEAAVLGFILVLGGLAIFIIGLVLLTALRKRGEEGMVRRGRGGTRGRRLLSMGLISFFAVLAAMRGGLFAMVAGGVVAGVGGYWLPKALQAFQGKRLRRAREKQIPAALDLLANGMRSGMSFIQAWTFASLQTPDPFREEMTATLNEIQLGRSTEEALENLRRRVECEDMDLAVSSIRLTLATGGDLPKGLATIAGTIRDRARMRNSIDALTSQGRLQAMLVAGIPLIMVFVTYGVDPARTSLLWTTGQGWILMGVLGVMDVIGFFAIQWICAIKI